MSKTKFLTIYVESCKDLLAMDRNGLSDPFITINYNGDKSTRKTTPIKYETLNPKWTKEEAEFTFNVDDPLTDTLSLNFWDFDKFATNDFLGHMKIPVALAANAENGIYDHDFELHDKKKMIKFGHKEIKERGKAHIILQYIDTSKTNVKPTTQTKNEQKGFDWEIPYEELELGKELGRGAFGVVYKGKWRLQDVAIKVLPPEKVSQMTEKDLEDFRAECNLMMNLRPHRNLLTLLGVSTQPGKPVCIVTDFVDGGSLESKLHNQQFQIDWMFIVKTVKGMAAGMHHLHQEGLLHRDLAARNVLLTGSSVPLISDFGLSTKTSKEQLRESKNHDIKVTETKFFRGPYKWMAPESLSKNEFSTKTDIWSFGVTVWEILTRELPFPNLDIYQARDGIIFHNLRLPIAQHWPQKWKDLLNWCWKTNPEERPDFVQLDKLLSQIEEETKIFTQQTQTQQTFPPQQSSYPPQQGFPPQLYMQQQIFNPTNSLGSNQPPVHINFQSNSFPQQPISPIQNQHQPISPIQNQHQPTFSPIQNQQQNENK